jgi:hypothetical protein
VTISPFLTAQNPQAKPQTSSEVELEKLRLEAAERARQEEEQKDWQTRIFEIKYAEPRYVRQALSMFRANLSPEPNSRIIGVRAPKEIMPAIEDAIKRLDVPTPRRNAELTAYIVMASDQPETGALPSSLQPVITELKKILTYKGFQLVDTLIARGGDGRDIMLQGVLPQFVATSTEKTGYDLTGRLSIENDGKASVLRINNLRFTMRFPSTPVGFPAPVGPTLPLTIATDVEIPQGQQVVVGKATFVDKAFILVMSAKFSN